MAFAVYDRVQETSSTTGTGSITLAGAVSGYQSFAVVGNGNTTYYTILNGTQWEVGIGTYSTSGPTLARTTILSNSNGNTSPITLSGSSSVFITQPAEQTVVSSNNPSTSGYVLTSGGTGVAPSWQPASGGGGLSWQSVQTANFTASAGNAYPVDTTAGAITVTLPASPSAGQLVTIVDYAGTAATNNISIDPNGSNLQSTTGIGVVSVNRQAYNLVYVDSTQGWVSYAQEYNALTQTAPPPSGDPYWTSVSLLTNSANQLSFADASTNNFAITNTGGVAPSLNSPFSGVGGSQYFNGSSYLSTPSNSALDCPGDFTFEGYFYLTAAIGSFKMIIANLSSNDTYIALTTGGTYGKLQAVAAAADQYNVDLVSAFTLNTWNYIAIVRSGSTLTGYINGVSLGSTTSTATFSFSNGQGTGIGKWGGGGLNWYGNMSNLRLVKGTALYTANFTPPTAPLTAVSGTSLLINATNQNTFDNSTFYDQSKNSFAISKSGSPVYSGLSPFGNEYAGSVYLNGSSNLTAPNNTAFAYPSAFTIELWLYPTTSIQSNQATILQEAGIGGIQLSAIDSTNFGFAAIGIAWILSSTTFPTINIWNHVVISRDSSNNISMFINGTRVANSTSSNSFPANTLYIGFGSSFGNYYNGNISNLRIVKGAAIYDPTQTTITVPTAPLPATTDTSLLLGCDTGAFYDLSNVGNPISQNGSPVVTTQVSPFSSVTESYYFNGSSYLSTPSSTSLQFGTGDFTVEGWFYYAGTTPSTDYGIFQIGPDVGGIGTSYASSLALLIDTGAYYKFYANGTYVTTSVSVTLNAWNNFAVVKNGSTLTLFVNGTNVFSQSDTFNYAGTYCGIGGAYNTSHLMQGYLSNFRITKGVARYTANFTPPTAPFPTSP